MAFKMKNTAYYKKRFAESETASPYNKNSDDDNILSKNIKDTRELSDSNPIKEKSYRGAIGPEESPEAIEKKKKNRGPRDERGFEKDYMDYKKDAEAYGDAYSYKKDKGDPGKKLKK
jgi:hypothetical protein